MWVKLVGVQHINFTNNAGEGVMLWQGSELSFIKVTVVSDEGNMH